MWYKRYGYKAPSYTSGGAIGCISVSLIGMTAIISSITLSVYFKNGWLLILAIPVSLVGFECVNRYAQHAGKRIRLRRYKLYVIEAEKYIAMGEDALALEAIRKAKIYGDLPGSLKELEEMNSANENA